MKWIKYILPFLFCLFVNAGETYYKNIVPGCPVGGKKVIGGLYKECKPKCTHKIKPIDNAKDMLVVSGYQRLQRGLTIALLAFICGLAFSNPIVHALSNIGLGGGGFLVLDGLLKIFVAQYLTILCWVLFIVILFIIIVRWRGHSITNSLKWIRGIFNGKGRT